MSHSPTHTTTVTATTTANRDVAKCCQIQLKQASYLVFDQVSTLFHRKQAALRLQQRYSEVKQESQSLLEKMNGLIASCGHSEFLPEAASQAFQRGCQILLTVQASLQQQQGTLDEEQVHQSEMSVCT